MGLRIYTVHLPTSSLRQAIARAVPLLIKEGFSWPACFLGVLWALWHRLWIEAAALIALFLAIGVILDFLAPGESIEMAVMIAIAVLIGASGNNWRRESLRRRGFLDAGVVAGPDPETALCRYLDLRAATRPDRPSASAVSGEVLPPLAPLADDRFTEEPPGEDSRFRDRPFAAEPHFETRDAPERTTDDAGFRPGEQADDRSPGRASPGTGYGG